MVYTKGVVLLTNKKKAEIRNKFHKNVSSSIYIPDVQNVNVAQMMFICSIKLFYGILKTLLLNKDFTFI